MYIVTIFVRLRVHNYRGNVRSCYLLGKLTNTEALQKKYIPTWVKYFLKVFGILEHLAKIVFRICVRVFLVYVL